MSKNVKYSRAFDYLHRLCFYLSEVAHGLEEEEHNRSIGGGDVPWPDSPIPENWPPCDPDRPCESSVKQYKAELEKTKRYATQVIDGAIATLEKVGPQIEGGKFHFRLSQWAPMEPEAPPPSSPGGPTSRTRTTR